MSAQTYDPSALEIWHEKRLTTLTKPDGWLSVVGLSWLERGTWHFGSSSDSDIVIANIPSSAGTVTLNESGSVTVRFEPDTKGTIDGKACQEATLSADPAAPTLAAIGDVSFYVIERNGRKALRIVDSGSRNRQDFMDIPRFSADPSWRIVADWVALETPQPFEVDSIIGTANTVLVTHKAVFNRDGRKIELWPTHGTETAPMFVLRDATSGHETYGASRFLTGEIDGSQIVLDFNKAINPPCAFTDFATCPLPPAENRLPFRIEAGEKLPRFRG
ncbi:DUF1684 domain-containing protein [Microvirga solisilvae]|uniref:DUF1684 domain-containing protein n=1 Tax=Microvirga solisilvae TaxID=2919498 RepID=UPI001FAF6B46|nr:DUF1684 domain-containing protein [Microvirga solisilvae]